MGHLHGQMLYEPRLLCCFRPTCRQTEWALVARESPQTKTIQALPIRIWPACTETLRDREYRWGTDPGFEFKLRCYVALGKSLTNLSLHFTNKTLK